MQFSGIKKCSKNSTKQIADSSTHCNSNILKQSNINNTKLTTVPKRSCNYSHESKTKNIIDKKRVQSSTTTDVNFISKLENVSADKKTNINISGNKTWLEVLKESPRKSNIEKENDAKIVSSTAAKQKSELTHLHNAESKTFKNLLEKLYNKVQKTNNKELLKLISEIINVWEHKKCSSNILGKNISTSSTDDLKSICKNTNITKLFPGCCDESRYKQVLKNNYTNDATLQTLIRLFESMQSVNEKTENHHESLQNVIHLINQLREENKMLNEVKEIRINLESKLATLNTENKYLRKQLQDSENERSNLNSLLKIKDTEIENLKNRIGKIKGTIAEKINSSNFNIQDEHFETIENLDETITAIPSNNQNLDVLIRPASSSPTDKMFSIQNNMFNEDGSQHQAYKLGIDDTLNQNIAQETYNNLRNNIKKTIDNFQLQTDINDVPLNLSDSYNYNISITKVSL